MTGAVIELDARADQMLVRVGALGYPPTARMKTGFAHFDRSYQENFCAGVLLLAMEFDDGIRNLVVETIPLGAQPR